MFGEYEVTDFLHLVGSIRQDSGKLDEGFEI